MRVNILRFFLGIFVFSTSVYSLLAPCSISASTSPFPLVGAIRWDAWFTGGPNTTDEMALTPVQWHDRLPFYANISSSTGEVQIRLDYQNQMDQEIASAKAGGLDYWAFDYYGDLNSISNALNKYLASASKNDIKFSLIILPQAISASDWPTSAVNHMLDSQYVKVLNGRPLVYVFASGSTITASNIATLRSAATTAGLPNPYIVWMTGNINDGKVAELGLDAVSAYALHPTGAADSVQPYSNLMAVNQSFWNQSISSNLKIVPLVSTGWDPRPRYAYPPPWGVGAHTAVAVGTSSEIAYNLQTAANWIASNPNTAEANAVIMYAWNEFAEGGWLDPLLQTGSERLDAISQVIGGTSSYDSQAPSVNITSPVQLSTVSGTTTISATATDNVGVVGVQFKLDGVNFGPEITVAPYTKNWDTMTVTNGTHTITAVARDAMLNSVSTTDLTVTVNNNIPAQPVGNWNLNDNTGTVTTDSSGNLNNGTLVSGANWITGKNGSGVNLDGVDDYVNIPDSAQLDGMKAVTVSTWVKLNNLPAQNFVVLGKDYGGASYRIAVGPSGYASFTVATANNPWYSSGTSVNSVKTLQTGVWNHVVGVYDGNYTRIYVNGVLENTAAQNISGNITNTSSSVRLGYKSSSNIDYTSGVVDEVSIYSVALSPAQVLNLYNQINLNADTTAPLVSLISPLNNSTVSGISTIEATVTDASSVSKIEFYIDGTLSSVVTNSPYTYSWDTRQYAHNTSHTVKAFAYDVANNMGTSSVSTVVVSDITPPSVSITSPANNAQLTRNTYVTIQATASDISGISNVQFKVNNVLKCSVSVAPYSCTWLVPNPRGVTYTLQAVGTDTANNISTSTISVKSK